MGSAVEYKLHAQFLRLFSLHDDVNDTHRAGANRLQNIFSKVFSLRVQIFLSLVPFSK